MNFMGNNKIVNNDGSIRMGKSALNSSSGHCKYSSLNTLNIQLAINNHKVQISVMNRLFGIH